MKTVHIETHCYSTTLPHSPRRKWGNSDRRVFSIQNSPVLPLSVSSTFSLRYSHPVAPYIFFLVFMSLPSFLQQRHLQGSPYAICDQSSYPSFVILHVGFSFPFWLCSTSFLTWYGHLLYRTTFQNCIHSIQKKNPILLIRWTENPKSTKPEYRRKLPCRLSTP